MNAGKAYGIVQILIIRLHTDNPRILRAPALVGKPNKHFAFSVTVNVPPFLYLACLLIDSVQIRLFVISRDTRQSKAHTRQLHAVPAGWIDKQQTSETRLTTHPRTFSALLARLLSLLVVPLVHKCSLRQVPVAGPAFLGHLPSSLLPALPAAS